MLAVWDTTMKQPYTETRPWGDFEQFTHNEQTTVKIITVKPHKKLSLQYHNHREEYWRVLDGQGEVVIDGTTHPANKGDSFHIPTNAVHRMQTGSETLVILEIAYGDFDEDDIVRLEDEYGRT